MTNVHAEIELVGASNAPLIWINCDGLAMCQDGIRNEWKAVVGPALSRLGAGVGAGEKLPK